MEVQEIFECGGENIQEGPVNAPTSTGIDNNEDIEHVKIDPAAAHKKFKAKSLDARAVDFSDGVGKAAGAQGYLSLSEYEIAAKGEIETPIQKLNRLRHEVSTFVEELEAASKAAAQPAAAGEVPLPKLVEQVRGLQQQLTHVALNEAAPEGFVSAQSQLTNELVAKLNNFKSTAATSSQESVKSPTAQTGKATDAVTYELYYKPEHASFTLASRIADLDGRLKAIEKAIGSESVSNVAADLQSENNLVSIASTLSSRVNDLDSIADIDARLKSVLAQVDAAKKKVEKQESSEHAARVTELYNTTKRWDSVAAAVPALIDRLQSLRALHDQASHFSSTITQLEQLQQQVSNSLTTQNTAISTLEASFAQNLQSIAGNFAALDARVQALKK